MIEGSFRTGGQEHFYLETQAALAIPGENRSISVYSSTQHPSEIQAMVAHCLGLRQNQVVCIATRMGGGFGGKESQAAIRLCSRRSLHRKTGRPARLVFSRDTDMRINGQTASVPLAVSGGFWGRRADRAISLELYSDGGCCLRPFTGRHGPFDPSRGQRVFYSPLRGLRERYAGPICRRTQRCAASVRRGDGGDRERTKVPVFWGSTPNMSRAGTVTAAREEMSPRTAKSLEEHAAAVIEQLADSSDYSRRRDEATRWNAASISNVGGYLFCQSSLGSSSPAGR